MKIGVRKPSISRSLKARTTSKLKRQVKRAIIPTYGQKGTGIIKDPKRAVYNKVYNKTTMDAVASIKKSTNSQVANQIAYSSNGAKLYPASAWYFPVGLLGLCSILYFFVNPAIAIILLIVATILFVVKIKNNPFKTKKDIQEAMEQVINSEENR
nr:MAG TPA: hypothetical protein [Caudoviricetes sp.]